MIKDYCWRVHPDGYIYGTNSTKLHRLLMNCIDPNLVVDHINGNRYDNRKVNLRICTQQQNAMNHGINSNNTSGVTGVNWHKASGKWMARIKVNYKTIYLGVFNLFDDAVQARKEAEEKYFGRYSYDNSRVYSKIRKGERYD